MASPLCSLQGRGPSQCILSVPLPMGQFSVQVRIGGATVSCKVPFARPLEGGGGKENVHIWRTLRILILKVLFRRLFFWHTEALQVFKFCFVLLFGFHFELFKKGSLDTVKFTLFCTVLSVLTTCKVITAALFKAQSSLIPPKSRVSVCAHSCPFPHPGVTALMPVPITLPFLKCQ